MVFENEIGPNEACGIVLEQSRRSLRAGATRWLGTWASSWQWTASPMPSSGTTTSKAPTATRASIIILGDRPIPWCRSAAQPAAGQHLHGHSRADLALLRDPGVRLREHGGRHLQLVGQHQSAPTSPTASSTTRTTPPRECRSAGRREGRGGRSTPGPPARRPRRRPRPRLPPPPPPRPPARPRRRRRRAPPAPSTSARRAGTTSPGPAPTPPTRARPWPASPATTASPTPGRAPPPASSATWRAAPSPASATWRPWTSTTPCWSTSAPPTSPA